MAENWRVEELCGSGYIRSTDNTYIGEFRRVERAQQAVTAVNAYDEHQQLIVELTGQLAEYEQKLRDVIHAIDVPTDDITYKAALEAARELLDKESGKIVGATGKGDSTTQKESEVPNESP